MGMSVEYHCPKCGKDYSVSTGLFFRSPATTEEVLAGEYGNHAKANLERHPGGSIMFSYEIFRCRCGYVRSKEVMRIFEAKQWPSPTVKAVWNNARCRCPRCRRNMHLTEDLPKKMRCDCGSWTEEYRVACMFD